MMRTDGRDNKGALASKSSLTSQNITKHKKRESYLEQQLCWSRLRNKIVSMR